MKDQLKTIHEALEGALSDDKPYIEKCKQALTALSELEAMAGEQEPVAWMANFINRYGTPDVYVTTHKHLAVENDENGSPRPLVFGDTTPVAQQPQAEPFGYVSQHTNGSWEFSPTAAGVYPDTAKSITTVYTKQPQAEKRCQYCDGTGDVHSIDGQWRGECHCQKQPQAKPHKPLFADLIAQHPGLREELKAMDEQQAEVVPKPFEYIDGVRLEAPQQAEGISSFLRSEREGWEEREPKPQAEPTDSMGMPLSCGKPLCSPGDHHPLCKLHKKPQAEAVQQWQPIETAPKDGTRVLAWNAEYGARETRSITYTPGSPGFAQGLKDRWWEWNEPRNNWALEWKPTHWMPLPAAPQQKGGAA